MDIETLRGDLMRGSCGRARECGSHDGFQLHADLRPAFDSIPEDRLMTFAFRKVRSPEMRNECADQIRGGFPDAAVRAVFAEAVFTGLDWAFTEYCQGRYCRDGLDAYLNSAGKDAAAFQEDCRKLCAQAGAVAPPAVEIVDIQRQERRL